MKIYFIADLHLMPQPDAISANFINFIDALNCTDVVFIMGDLFDFWIGDDATDPVIEQIKHSLKNATAKGIKCYFICGNRDFLIGKKFATSTGLVLLNDYHQINYYNQQILLCHGDTLCVNDEKYQKYRKIVHIKWLQKLFLLLPLKIRVKIGQKIRNTSRNQGRQSGEIDIDFANKKVQQFKAKVLIHGHTHREKIHQHHEFTRIVLGDWHLDRSSILVLDEKGFKFITKI